MDKYEILGFLLTGIVIIGCLYIYFDNYGAFDLKCIVRYPISSKPLFV